MARMLQALKNLESRTARPSAGQAKAKAQSAPPAPYPRTPTVEPESPAPGSVNFDLTPAVSLLPPVAVPSPSETIESLHRLVTGLAGLETGGPDALFANPPAATSDPSPPAQKQPAGPAITDIERMVRRTLADSARSRPLRDLVDRLQRDMAQTAAKTVALVGVTEGSATHQSVLLAATLMAQRGIGSVLMVDGDASRRSLSEMLEYGRDAGLADVLRDSGSAREACRLTATENVSFLPNGSSQAGDFSPPGRIGQVFGELSHGFACALVDCGRVSDAGASALACAADATYLVVQLGTVETSVAQAALSQLRAAGSRVLGCIVV
jgi:Mrp family chromosome partitioning ATPase